MRVCYRNILCALVLLSSLNLRAAGERPNDYGMNMIAPFSLVTALYGIATYVQTKQTDEIKEIPSALPADEDCGFLCQISAHEVREDVRSAKNTARGGYVLAGVSTVASFLGALSAHKGTNASVQASVGMSVLFYLTHIITTGISNGYLWDLRWDDVLMFSGEDEVRLHDATDEAINWGIYPFLGGILNTFMIGASYMTGKQSNTVADTVEEPAAALPDPVEPGATGEAAGNGGDADAGATDGSSV